MNQHALRELDRGLALWRRPLVAGWLWPLLILGFWGGPAGAQILTNGGFESGLTSWTTALSSGGAATFATVSTNVHSGAKTLLVTVSNPGTGSNSVQLVSSAFNASSADTYVLRFWASSPVLLANLGIDFLGATPAFPQIPFELSTNPVVTGTDGNYQEYLYAFRASGTVQIAFNFQSTAQYWLDDVEVLDLTNNDGFDVPMTYLWQWGELKYAQTNGTEGNPATGWTGGDNDKSALLPDGTVAWIFNDSYASSLNSFYSNLRGNSSLPRNCLLHQIGTNLVWLNNGANSFFPPNTNGNLMPAAPNGLYWIAGAIAETNANKLYVLLNGLNNSPLSNICMSVATLSLPGLTLDGAVTNLTSPGTDNFGDLVRGDDGYEYIYNGAKVARVPAGQLAVDSAWTYWNGSGWVTDHTQNVAIPNFSGWSISRLGTSNYVAVFFPYLDFVDIEAQFAPSPMGPWTTGVVVGQAAPQWGEIMYAPNICAGTGGDGIFTIGYSDNGSPENWFSKTASDKSWYNPHFIRANLLQLSPYTLNAGTGGPGSRMSIKFAADQNYGHDTINNLYGAGALNTTNWFNFGIGSGASGVTNVPFYTYNGQKYATGAKMLFSYASEMTHTVNQTTGTNNIDLLESWINVNNNGWYLSVTNLDGPFTNGYSVYFYYHGSAVGYGGQNYIRYYAGQTTNSPVLGTEQWNLFTTVAANPGTLTQDLTRFNTGTAGETAGANYLVFTNLSGGAFDLLITNGNNGGVNAIEIVANTLPVVAGPIVSPSTFVYPGASVSLTCATNGGVGPLSDQWQAGPDGINWTNLAGATATNLTLNNFTAGNAGYYQMVYTANAVSATSAVVQLTYFATLPTISATVAAPGNTVNQGTTVTLSCTTNGGAEPFGLQWQASPNGVVYTNVPGAGGLSLALPAAVPGNSGYYQCVFTAAGLSVTSAPALLTVQPLAISPATVVPSNPVFSGQSAVLICSNFSGLGSYNLQWQASPNGVAWTNLPGAVTNWTVLLGVTPNNAGYYQCVLNAANGSVTSAPVHLTVLQTGNAAPRLAIKFAPDQNYNHCFINQNWTTPATKQPAGVLNTTNWNNWNVSGSAPFIGNGLFYDVKGSTNGNLSSATIVDYHGSGEQCVYYNGNWPQSWFTNNNAVLLDSAFWYGQDQLACQVTNLDPVFATNGYSLYVYYLGASVTWGEQVCLANYSGRTTNSLMVNSQVCSIYTTTNWNSFNSGAYLTNGYFVTNNIFTPAPQTTATTHGSYPAFETPGADYVVFSNCPASGAFSLAVSNTFYAGICGIEIMATVAGTGLSPSASVLALSTNVLFPGATVVFTNTVSPAPPNGEYVVFLDGGTVLGVGTLSAGAAVCNATGLSAGSHSLSAVYPGDGNYLASTSSVVNLTAVATPAVSAPVVIPAANVYAGMTVTLVCSNYSGTPPYSFQWQASGDGVTFTNVSGATASQITLASLQPGNAADYQLAFTADGLTVTSSVVQLTVNPPVAVSVQPAAGSLVLTWPQGTLLQATNVTGPWTTNPAASPFTNQPNNPQMFYRVQVQ